MYWQVALIFGLADGSEAGFLNLLARVRITPRSPFGALTRRGRARFAKPLVDLKVHVNRAHSAPPVCGYRILVLLQSSKLEKRVRFPLPAPICPIPLLARRPAFQADKAGSKPAWGATQCLREEPALIRLAGRIVTALCDHLCWICSTARSGAAVNRVDRIRLPSPVPLCGCGVAAACGSPKPCGLGSNPGARAIWLSQRRIPRVVGNRQGYAQVPILFCILNLRFAWPAKKDSPTILGRIIKTYVDKFALSSVVNPIRQPKSVRHLVI